MAQSKLLIMVIIYGRVLSNSAEKTSLSELSGTSSFLDPLQFEPISSDAESVRSSENLVIETEPVNETTVKRFDIMDQIQSGSGRNFVCFSTANRCLALGICGIVMSVMLLLYTLF